MKRSYREQSRCILDEWYILFFFPPEEIENIETLSRIVNRLVRDSVLTKCRLRSPTALPKRPARACVTNTIVNNTPRNDNKLDRR